MRAICGMDGNMEMKAVENSGPTMDRTASVPYLLHICIVALQFPYTLSNVLSEILCNITSVIE